MSGQIKKICCNVKIFYKKLLRLEKVENLKKLKKILKYHFRANIKPFYIDKKIFICQSAKNFYNLTGNIYFYSIMTSFKTKKIVKPEYKNLEKITPKTTVSE